MNCNKILFIETNNDDISFNDLTTEQVRESWTAVFVITSMGQILKNRYNTDKFNGPLAQMLEEYVR